MNLSNKLCTTTFIYYQEIWRLHSEELRLKCLQPRELIKIDNCCRWLLLLLLNLQVGIRGLDLLHTEKFIKTAFN